MLFENARRVSLAEGIDELVIVPDGWLWYVPFELLPVASNRAGDDRRPLRQVYRIRYSPTRSLAVLRFEPPAGGGTGLLIGRMSRGEKPEAALAAAGEMTAGITEAIVLDTAAPGPPAATPAQPDLVASLFDTLVVYDELVPAAPGAAWPLLSAVGPRPGISLAEWLAPPPKRPQRVILPGVQSAMAGGLAKPPARPGEDLFLPAVDLIAAGGNTVLLSRWKSGGAVATGLIHEFLRETVAQDALPPAEAWQRAVDLNIAERPDLDREPRLKRSAEADLADASHPLLWAGHLLVDCGPGVYAAAAEPVVPPVPPLAAPGPGIPAPAPAPAGPMPPAILAPPPPRPDPPVPTRPKPAPQNPAPLVGPPAEAQPAAIPPAAVPPAEPAAPAAAPP